MSTPFLYVLMCIAAVFSIAFWYKSGPFLGTENSIPLSNSGDRRALMHCFFCCVYLCWITEQTSSLNLLWLIP